jgi:hypothetical protein
MRDHEVEVAGDPARSEDHQGHPSNEHWLEAEPAEILNDFADRLEVIQRVRHC